MRRTVRAVFDSEVLRSEEPLDLQPNARYDVIIEGPALEQRLDAEDLPLQRYAVLAQDLGIEDLAAQHEHYLYGVPWCHSAACRPIEAV